MSFSLHANSIKRQRASFVTGLVIAVFGLLSLGGFAAHKVSAYAQDCDNNSIIKCGYSDPGNFIAHVTANDSLNGHHDLQAIYSHYNLSPSDYSRFASSARPGVAYKDGRIVVDGVVVATNGMSIGREASGQGSGYSTTPINGVNYYGNTNAKAFANDALPVYAIFNGQGVLQFAVLQGCGNPEFGLPVVPHYSCNMLNVTQLAGSQNTYTFTTNASASNNASINHVRYEFSDGTYSDQTNPATPVQHTFTKSGTYTAKVTVYVNLPGGQVATVAAAGQCLKQITVKIITPFYQCVQLAGAILSKEKREYKFVATAKYGNGAQLVSADFQFGDGNSTNGVKPDANGTTITTSHAYDKAGNYNAQALLHFTVAGKAVTAPACKALVTPTKPPTPECKPGVPVGSPECTPCVYNPNVPTGSPECVPPQTNLPNTGAGNTIAIFSAVVVGGFLIYRQLLFRRHKAAFVAAERGTSPLPLGQPLDADAPLAGTPLEQKSRRNFRRRQF